jgi:putative tryptophan/tyrosine transport system substrate-binding protein
VAFLKGRNHSADRAGETRQSLIGGSSAANQKRLPWCEPLPGAAPGGLTGTVLEPERGIRHVRFWRTADLGLRLALIASDVTDRPISDMSGLRCTALNRLQDLLYLVCDRWPWGKSMRRREFITLLGGAAAWPLVARAQPSSMPVIGFLSGGSPRELAYLASAFRKGLNEAGYVEGRNVAIEYRWGEGQYDRLPALAANLVLRQVTVLAATTTPGALAAKGATSTIPIVFTIGADAIAIGLVDSLSRPSGNITGVNNYLSGLGQKRLELLRDLVPNAAVIGMLVNPNFPDAESQAKDVTEAARKLGQEVHVVNATSQNDFDRAFASLVQLQARALLVTVDPVFNSGRQQLISLAARHKIPAMYFAREFVVDGGLMSYASNLADGYRQAGIYVGRILKGAKPADLPVVQPTKFDLVINLKTAKALGLTVPMIMQMTADEVIE